MMRNIKMKTKMKMTKGALLAAVFSVLVMGGNASLITPADASTDPVVEAVAVVEVVSGFTNTYNVGLSFTNNNDCLARIQQLNMMLNNLVAQGVPLGGKPIEMACAQSSVIEMPARN